MTHLHSLLSEHLIPCLDYGVILQFLGGVGGGVVQVPHLFVPSPVRRRGFRGPIDGRLLGGNEETLGIIPPHAANGE